MDSLAKSGQYHNKIWAMIFVLFRQDARSFSSSNNSGRTLSVPQLFYSMARLIGVLVSSVGIDTQDIAGRKLLS